jgi:hypothetical protein
MTQSNTDEWIISHIATVESTMMGFLGVSVSILVFPLALYSPTSPHLLTLAFLGYCCSWAFLLAVVGGMCLRIKAIKKKSKMAYHEAMVHVSDSWGYAFGSMMLAIASVVLLMAVPPIYVEYLPLSNEQIPFIAILGLSPDVFGVSSGMRNVWIVGNVIILLATLDVIVIPGIKKWYDSRRK